MAIPVGKDILDGSAQRCSQIRRFKDFFFFFGWAGIVISGLFLVFILFGGNGNWETNRWYIGFFFSSMHYGLRGQRTSSLKDR